MELEKWKIIEKNGILGFDGFLDVNITQFFLARLKLKKKEKFLFSEESNPQQFFLYHKMYSVILKNAKVKNRNFYRQFPGNLNQKTNGPVSLTWVHRICWIRTSLEIHDYMLYKLSSMQKY